MIIDIKAFSNKDPDSRTKAFINMFIDDLITIRNLPMVLGKNGLYVEMPKHKIDKDGKTVKEDVYFLTDELKEQINRAAIESYNNNGKIVTFKSDSTVLRDKILPGLSLRENVSNFDSRARLRLVFEEPKEPGGERKNTIEWAPCIRRRQLS